MYLSDPFTDLLNKTKQALKLNLYPSIMIDLLKIKEKIPRVINHIKEKSLYKNNKSYANSRLFRQQ